MVRAMISVVAAVLLAGAGAAQAPPVIATDQPALIRSDDPRLAANKKLVYDMVREVLQGGHADRITDFFTLGYIQHNPNVASGRDSLAKYISGSRPVRPIEPVIRFPLITMLAERDLVVMVNGRPLKDAAGNSYMTTWFDMFRIENGRIAEHWDPAPKDDAMLHFDPNSTRQK